MPQWKYSIKNTLWFNQWCTGIQNVAKHMLPKINMPQWKYSIKDFMVQPILFFNHLMYEHHCTATSTHVFSDEHSKMKAIWMYWARPVNTKHLLYMAWTKHTQWTPQCILHGQREDHSKIQHWKLTDHTSKWYRWQFQWNGLHVHILLSKHTVHCYSHHSYQRCSHQSHKVISASFSSLFLGFWFHAT